MPATARDAINIAQAVLLDFDGVILDTEWPIYQTWLKLFQREGHDLPPETYVKCIGSDFDTWSPETHLEQLTGKTFDWESENVARQVEIVDEVAKLPPLPGVTDLIASLQHRTSAVVSSSSHHWVDGWLDKLNFTQYLNTTVCRGDAPRIKPAPDLYLEAAKQLGLAPEHCLVIEDSRNGMLSAQAAGMPVIIVPNRLTKNSDFSGAQHRANSISELL